MPPGGVPAESEDDNVHLTVAVLTFRRDEDLRAVLPLLEREVRALLAADADVRSGDVLVVDNDPGAGARPVVEGRPASDVTVRYVHEPVPGIPAARNRALAEADPGGLLVFIDDDERPEAGWLARLVATWRAYDAAAVSGPVRSEFDGPVDPWISAGGYFRREHRLGTATGTVVAAAATNNLLLDLRVVTAVGLRFDATLGLAGGEDTLFTRRLTAAGVRIVWCAEAVVVDRVPAGRLTRRWVVRRVFATSNASTRVLLRLAGTPAERAAVRVRYGSTGVARVAAGAARAVLGTLAGRDSWQAQGLGQLARGAGTVAAVVGHGYQEYRR